jgi:hypothetical protein
VVEQGILVPMFFRQQIIYSWDLTYVLVSFVPIYFGCAITSTFYTMYYLIL